MSPSFRPPPAPSHQFVHLTGLTLRDFRNIARADVVCPASGAVLVGDNGQGKTNFLEAVAYFGLLRSVRNARDRDVVRHHAVAAHLRGTIQGQAPCDIAIGIERTTGRKKISLDGVDITRRLDALGTLPSVSWSPADVSLVAGGPAERRRYLDVMLALSLPSYLHALRNYRAALERRNATLRDALRRGRDDGTAAAWEPALAEHGATLVRERRAWVDERRGEFAALCAAIGEHAASALAYDGDAADAADAQTALATALARTRAHDVHRGTTSVGPHRDDLVVTLDEHDARTFGSAGQQRTAAIALRLLEARTMRAHGRGAPVLLLDDPFAELDATRTARTLAVLAREDIGQVMLAVPRASDIPAHFAGLSRFTVRSGEVHG